MDGSAFVRAIGQARASTAASIEVSEALSARIETLLASRAGIQAAQDVREGSVVYPALIRALRDARRYREALKVAEEGLALTHDPLIARLADEAAHDLAEAEQDRC
jgi:hypothetical protein